MALLASRCHSRVFLSRLLSHPALVTRVPDHRRVAMRSKQFPEYCMLYNFDKVVTASRINKMKMQGTLVYAAAMPALYMAQTLSGLVTPNLVDSFFVMGGIITIFMHSIGFLFNDVIGYIYLKDDNESVKISYVDYWGDRINVETKIDEISALSETAARFSNPWYHRVKCDNTKKTLKLYLTSGTVLDETLFNAIFGKAHTE